MKSIATGAGRTLARFFLGAAPFLFLLALWQLVTSLALVQPFFLPNPESVLAAILDGLSNGPLLNDLGASTRRVLIGYVIACTLAVPLGVVLGRREYFRIFFEPFNNFVRYTPLPAFIPLIVLWVGIGEANPITVIFLGVFWTLVIMVADAVKRVPEELVEMARTLGLGDWNCIASVVIPSAMPGIFNALRISAGLAWSSLVLAEIVGSNTGLGHMIMEAQRFLRTDKVLAGVLIVGFLGLMIDKLFDVFYNHLFHWTNRVNGE